MCVCVLNYFLSPFSVCNFDFFIFRTSLLCAALKFLDQSLIYKMASYI